MPKTLKFGRLLIFSSAVYSAAFCCSAAKTKTLLLNLFLKKIGFDDIRQGLFFYCLLFKLIIKNIKRLLTLRYLNFINRISAFCTVWHSVPYSVVRRTICTAHSVITSISQTAPLRFLVVLADWYAYVRRGTRYCEYVFTK